MVDTHDVVLVNPIAYEIDVVAVRVGELSFIAVEIQSFETPEKMILEFGYESLYQ